MFYVFLYLWEYDIENNIDMCEQLIQKYIKQKGILENYHSFNWQLVNGSLILKDSLIKPYQDMKTDEYRHILKKKVGWSPSFINNIAKSVETTGFIMVT